MVVAAEQNVIYVAFSSAERKMRKKCAKMEGEALSENAEHVWQSTSGQKSNLKTYHDESILFFIQVESIGQSKKNEKSFGRRPIGSSRFGENFSARHDAENRLDRPFRSDCEIQAAVDLRKIYANPKSTRCIGNPKLWHFPICTGTTSDSTVHSTRTNSVRSSRCQRECIKKNENKHSPIARTSADRMLFPEIKHLPILSTCLPLNEIAETITENLYANDEEKKKWWNHAFALRNTTEQKRKTHERRWWRRKRFWQTAHQAT